MASDDFTRADGGLGANWTALTSTFTIASNKCEPSNSFEDAMAMWGADSFSDDQFAEATVAGLDGTGAGTGIGLLLRADISNTFYRIFTNAGSTDNVTIDWFDNGSFGSVLATRSSQFTDGDVLRAEAEGTTLRVYKNGVQLGADITDSSITTNGGVGLSYSSALQPGATLDGWSGGDLSAGTDATVTATQATATAEVVAPPRPRPDPPFSEVTIRM